MIRSPDDNRDRNSGAKTSSPLKPILIGCGLIFVIVVGFLAFFGLWFAGRVRQMNQMADRAAQDYAALNKDFAFKEPDAKAAIPEDRAAAYIRVRDAVMTTVPDELNAKVEEMMTSRNIKGLSVFLEAGDILRFVNAATQAHVEALRKEKMSPDEYLWLHGRVLNSVLKRDATDSKREPFEKTMKRLEEVSAANRQWNPPFEQKEYMKQMETAYGKAPAVPDSVLMDFKPAATELGTMIDLFVANPRVLDEIQRSARSYGRRRVPATPGANP